MYNRDFVFEPENEKEGTKEVSFPSPAQNSEEPYVSFDDEEMTQVIMDV